MYWVVCRKLDLNIHFGLKQCGGLWDNEVRFDGERIHENMSRRRAERENKNLFAGMF